MINGNEEVDTVRQCVEGSFEVSDDRETDNSILREDRIWAEEHNLVFHPSVVINDQIFKGDISGKDLAFGICEAFEEMPDECDLTWKIEAYQEGIITDF